MLEKKTSSEAMQQFCTFRIGGVLYGINIHYVKEIYPEFRITPVPHAPPFISGLVNIRGEIYLVFHLRHCLGYETRAIDGEHRIMLFKNIVSEPCGILVDEIADVLTVTPSQIEPYHAEGGMEASLQALGVTSQLATRLIQGVYQLRRELMIILSVPALLEI